jgi:predicted RNA polymerase sigma factor
VAGWHLFHVSRAEMHRQTGDSDGARDAYRAALALDPQSVERDHIERRLASLA